MRLRRWAVPVVLIPILVPNTIAALFNYVDNRHRIIETLTSVEQVKFDRLAAVVNAIAFPIGIAVICWLTWRIVRGLRALDRGKESLSASETASLHRECLRLGERTALVCLTLWTIAGIAYPLILRTMGVTMTARWSAHFVGSLFICGLIAVAYPFFGVTYFAVRSLFPALLHHRASGPADEAELTRLHRRLGKYLVVAGSVPLLAIGGLIAAIGASRSRLLSTNPTWRRSGRCVSVA